MASRVVPAGGRGRAKISVLLALEPSLLRDGLRCILGRERDLTVVAESGDGSQAVREAERHAPRVAVLGIALAALPGIEAARVMAERSPAVAALVVSMRATPAEAQRALDAGALGYVAGDCSAEEFVKCVRAVAAGNRHVSSALAGKLLEHTRAVQRERSVESLTATERHIVKLVAEGESNPAVAKVLGLSPRTVETYRLRLMRKLGIENLASLVRYAIRHGITALD